MLVLSKTPAAARAVKSGVREAREARERRTGGRRYWVMTRDAPRPRTQPSRLCATQRGSGDTGVRGGGGGCATQLGSADTLVRLVKRSLRGVMVRPCLGPWCQLSLV